MRSRMSSSRGPQRVLITVAVLMALAGVVQYWRLRTVNADLTDQLVRLEALLQAAEEKSSKIDSQRKETGEDLKKVHANFQQLQITKDEEATKCKHLQENLEELIEKKDSLQKELEDDKENHDAELGDMAKKLKALQAELAESRRQSGTELSTAQQELDTVRQQLTAAQQTAADAASCRSQLTQAQSELAECRTASAGQPAVAAGQPVVAAGQAAAEQPAVAAGQAAGQPAGAAEAAASDGSRGAWPGLKVPQPGLSQQLFESAGLAGGFQQAQGRAGQAAAQQRVLPVPPGAGAAAAASSSTSTSAKPAVGQDLDPLAKPQSREEAVEGAGVLAPPQQQPQEPAAAAQEEPQLGLDDGDGGLQYPMESGKDAMNDHPDTDGEADAESKDAALIKGLLELSNKSGRHEELPGPEPQAALGEGGMSAPELVGAVPAPELTGGDQPPLPLR